MTIPMNKVRCHTLTKTVTTAGMEVRLRVTFHIMGDEVVITEYVGGNIHQSFDPQTIEIARVAWKRYLSDGYSQ